MITDQIGLHLVLLPLQIHLSFDLGNKTGKVICPTNYPLSMAFIISFFCFANADGGADELYRAVSNKIAQSTDKKTWQFNIKIACSFVIFTRHF